MWWSKVVLWSGVALLCPGLKVVTNCFHALCEVTTHKQDDQDAAVQKAIVEAASSGDLDVVKNLVLVDHAFKVNVEQRSRDGRTAMTAAAANGHQNVVEWLRDEFGHDNQEAAVQTVPMQMVAKF